MGAEIGVIAQIVGMAAMLLGGGIALGKLFSDNGTIKTLLKEHSERMTQLVSMQARLEAESKGLDGEVRRVRDRLDQFVDGKSVSRVV